MSAVIRFLSSDALTVITSLDLAAVNSPGNSGDTSFYVENTGDKTATALQIALSAVGLNDGVTYAQMASDNSGSPGIYDTQPISLGDLAVLQKVRLWTRANLPANVTKDGNPRRYNFDLSGFTL